MTSTFLNISTDTTLGGSSASDSTVASQKAIKAYADNVVSGKQDTSNLVTSVSASSTDAQYPSAKLFYDTCGDIETLINAL